MNWITRWQSVVVGLAVLNSCLLFVKKLSPEIALVSLFVPLLLLLLSRDQHNISPKLYAGLLAVGSVTGAVASAYFVLPILIANVTSPPEWDFLCFWANGSVAAAGKNFYQAASYQGLILPLSPSEDFVKEILQVGFHFPTPSMLLYMPLTWLEFEQAYVLWLSLQAVAIALSVVLLARRFAPTVDSERILVVLALFLFLGASRETFASAQTNFFILACFLLYLLSPKKMLTGSMLGLALFFKPIVAVMLLQPLINREWRAILGFSLSVFIAFLVSYFVFGGEIVWSYFFSDIPGRVPSHMYTQDLNQSLLSVLLRISDPDPFPKQPIFSPLFIVCAGGLTALTSWRLLKFGELRRLPCFSLLLVLALLCYPGTLTHYNVLLILPILTLWDKVKDNSDVRWLWLFALSVVVILTQFSSWLPNFLALLLLWAALFRECASEKG